VKLVIDSESLSKQVSCGYRWPPGKR